MFAVRIVKVEHYLAAPVRDLDVCYSDFRNCQLSQVPVVRIFGCTPAGQRTCVHLHGVFPYIYIPYNGTTPVDQYMHQLAATLDHALITDKSKPVAGVHYVYKIELVSGTPFYGYHAKEHQFLKIYFLNPQIVERAVELLQNGAIMNQIFQPHEAHIPFVLQMFIDYNLYGMNLIKFSNIKFRRKNAVLCDASPNTSRSYSLLSNHNSDNSISLRIWDPDCLPSEMFANEFVTRQSTCELEIDALAADILNTLELTGVEMNPGIEAIWEDERWRRKQMNESSQFTPCSSQDRQPLETTKTELQYLEKINKIHMDTASEDPAFFEDSQVHCRSGVEVDSLCAAGLENSERDSESSPLLLNISSLRFTQRSSQGSHLSQNNDDKEFLELLMDMVETGSESDYPLSPATCESDFENEDELAMSQFVYYAEPGSEVPTPHIANRSISNVKSVCDSAIPQVDGPPDLPEKDVGSLEDFVHCQMPDKTCSYNSKVSKHDLDSSSVSYLQDVSSPDEHPQELSVVGDQPVQYKSKRKDHSDGVDDKDASSNKNNLQEFEVVSEALRCNSSQAAQFEKRESTKLPVTDNVVSHFPDNEVPGIASLDTECSKKSSCGHRKLTSEIDVGNPAQIIDDVTKLFEVVKITPTTKIDPNYNLVSTFKSCANEMACQETVTGESDERGKNAVCDNNTFIPLDKPLLWDESNSNTDSANGIDRHICRRRQGRPRPPRPTCIRTSYRRKHDCNQRSLLQPNSGHDMNDKDLIARTAICDSKMDYLGCEQENLTDSITQGSSCTSPRKNSEKHSSLVGESTLELLSTCDESLFDSRGLDQTQQLGKRRRGRPRSSSHTLHVENNSRCRRRQVCVNTSATTDCVSEVDSNNECQSFHQTETQRVENICNPKHNLHQSKPHYGQCQGRATGIVTRRQKVLMQTEICSGASETVEIGDKESDFDTSDQCVDRSPATKLKLRFGDKRQCPVTDCERVISRSLRSQLKIVPERSHRNSKMSLRNIGCRAGNVKRKDITSKTDDICKVKQSFTPDLCAPTGNLKGTKRNTCRETACHNYGHKVVSGSGRIPLNEKEPESTVENASEKVESRSILEIKAVSRGTSTPNFENLHDGTGITSNVLDANGSDVDDYALSSTVIEMELVSSRNNTQTMPGTEENVKVELNASNKICQGLSPTTVDKVNVSSCENKSSLRGNSRRTGRLRKVRMGSLYRDSTPSLSPQESTSSIKEGNEPTVEEDDVCSLNSESYVKSAVRHSSRLSRRAFCKTLTDVALQTSVSNVKKSRDISSLDTTASRADEGHLENCQANEILQRSEESSRSYQKNFKEDSCSAVDSNNCTYNDALCYQELSDATTKNAEFDRNHSDSFSKETPKGEVLKTGATSQDLRNFPPNSKLRRSSRKRSVRFLPDPFKAMRSRKPASYFIELTDVHSLGCQQNPDPASFNDATSPRNVPTDILNSENSEINGTSEISPLNTSTLKDCVGKNPSSGSTHEVPEVAAFDELNDTLKENETKNCDPCMKETSTVEKYQSDSMLKSTPGKRRRGRRKRFSKIKRRSYLCRRKQSYSLPQCGKTPSHVMDSESAVSDVSDNEYYEKKPKNKNKYSFMGDFGDSPPHIAESEVEPGCLTTIQTLNYINESCSTQNSENHPNDEGQKNKNECYFSANSVTENIDITERSNGPAEAKHDTEPRNANIIGGENSVQNETLSEEVNVSIESSEIPSSQVCEKVNTGSYRGRKKVSFVNNSEAVSVINEPSRKRLSRLHHHVGTRVSNDDQAVIEYNRKIQRRSIRFQRNYGNLLDSVCPEVISDSSIIKKPVDNSDNSVILSRRGRLSLQRHRQHRSSLSLEFASDALNNAKCDVIVSDEESDVSKVEHEGETSLQCFPDLVNDNKNDIVSTEEPLLPSCNVQKTLEANRCIVSKVDDGKTLEICVKDITVKLVPDDIMEESLQQLGCEVVLISRISEELESVKRHKYDDVDCLPTSTPVAQKTKWKKIVMVSSDEDSIDAVETIFCSEELDEGQDKEISLESPEIKEDSCFPFESGMRDIVKAKSKCKRVVFSDEDDEDTQDEEDEETQDEEDDSDSLAESDRPFTRSRGEAPIISPRTKYLRQRRRPSRFCGDDLSDFIVESSVSDTSNYSEFSCSDDEMSSNVNTSEDDQELSDSDESDSYFQRRRLTRRKNLRPKRKLSPKTVKKEENVGSDNVLDSVAVQNPEEVNSCELATVLPLGMRKSKRYGVDYNPHAYHLFFNPSTALIDSSPSVFNSQRRKKLENTGPKVLATDVPLTLNPYVKLNRLTSADIEKYQNVQQASVSIGELQGDVNEAWDHFTSFWKDKTTENLTMLELPKVTKESNSDADDAFSVENGGEPFDSYSADEDGGNSPMSHEHTAAVEHNSGVDVSKTVCNTNNLKTATFSDYLPDFSDEEEEDTLNEDDRYGGYEDALYKMSFWSPTPGDDASEAARTPPRCSSPSGSLNELTNENENQEITMLRDDNAVANCENNETMQKRLIGDGSNPTLDVVNGMSLGTIEDLFNRGLSGGLNSRSSRGRNVARRGRPFSKSTSCKRTRVPVNRYTSMISPSRGKSRRGRPRNRGRKIRLGSINPKPYQLMREALPNTPPPLQIVIKEHNRNSHRNVGLTVESIRTGEKKSKKKPLVKILSSNPYVEPSCGKLLTKMLNGLNPQINTHGDELGETAPLSAAHPGFPRDLTLEQRNEISALSLRKLRWTRKKMRPRKKKPPNPPKLDVTTVLARVPAVDGEPWRFPGLETGASWSFGLTYSNSHVKRFAVPASRMQLPLASGESHQFLGAYRGTAGNWMQTGQTGESWTANMNVNEDQPNIGDRDATTNTVNVSQSTLGEQSEIGRPPLLESNTDGKTASQSSSFALPNVNRLPFGLPNSGLVDNSGDPIDWKEVLEAGEEDMWMAFGSANTANEIHLKKGLVKRHHKDVPTLPSTRGVELCSGSTELKDNLLNSNQMLSSQSQKGGSDGPFANSQRSYFTQKSLQSTHATHLPFSQNVMSASENFSKKLPSDSQMLSSNFSNHSTKTRISSQSFESRTKSVVEPRCNVNQSVIPLGRPEEKLNEPFVVPLVVRPPVPDTPVCDLTLSPRSYGGDKSPEIFDCWDGIQPTGSFQDFPFTFQAPVFNDTFLKPADKSSDPAQASKTGSHVVKTRTSDIHPLPETTENGQATSTEKMTCETVKPVNDVSSQCIAEFSDDDDDNIGPSGDIIKTLERVVEGLNFKIGESRVTATEEECSSSETRILQLDGTSRKSRNSTEDVDQDAESTFIELVGSSLKEIPSSDNTFSGNSISRVDVHTLTPLTACNVTASDDVDNDVSEIVDHQDGTPIASTSSREVEPHSSCSKVPSTEECDDEADLNLTPIQSFYLYGDEEAPWSSTTVLQDESIESGSVISSINSERIGRSKANLSTKCMLGGVLLSNVTVLSYVFTPPSPTAIENSLANYSIPEIRYPLVHCSNITDVPKKPLQLGGGTVILKLGSKSLSELQDCESDLCVTGLSHWRQVIKVVEENGSLCASGCDFESKTTRKPMRYRGVCFEFWPPPPSSLSVRKWLHDHCKGTGIDSVSPLVIRNARLKTISGHIFARQDNKNELLFPTAMENDYDRSILPLVPMKSASFSMHSTPNFSYLVKANRRRRAHGTEFTPESLSAESVSLTLDVVSSELLSPTKKVRRANEIQSLRSPRRLSALLTPKKDSPKALLSGIETPLLRRKLFDQKLKSALRNVDGGNTVPSTSQLDGPSPQNTYGFKMSAESLNEAKSFHVCQYLTLMSLELHVRTDGDLYPNPRLNPICAIFYHVTVDAPSKGGETEITGILVIEETTSGSTIGGVQLPHGTQKSQDSPTCRDSSNEPYFWKYLQVFQEAKVTFVRDEFSLIQELIKVVHFHDPDIILGYEVEMYSWGFLLERASALGLQLCPSLSRIPDDSMNIFHPPQEGKSDSFTLNLSGRIVLNVWEIMKHEVALYGYTFENVAYHVLHRRIPQFSFRTLTSWFDRTPHVNRWRTLQHYLIRVKGSIQLLEQLNLVGRTSELARLFGIQFYEVLSRGSQFRVESMMLRLCRKSRFVAVSPSVQQRATMNAPEFLPLILEPESKFYTSPVVVLDFQSLYPSMVIAYNYCFSTCLGKVDNFGQSEALKFGCTSLKVPPGLLMKLKDRLSVSPCGVAFVKPEVRKGILPRMLEEILTARIMVKTAMKKRKNDKALYRVLDSRQLGLKLIANVTYGYTAANFSGRMPCVEVADSIVSKGRETLERAIELIHNTSKWKARVVYGDTDSVFVLLDGRTKEQAFAIGQEIAQAVTAVNPKPVKLKLEKVYLPCVLQTKKRYVGYMFESSDQTEPKYDAKGIETVRRDGCPAVAKILEKSLKILFATYDVSQAKTYVQHQFSKIVMGRVALDSFIFSRKYRGRNGYHLETHAPALKIANQLLRHDPRSEPRLGERVPYVIVYGSPGSTLIQLICHPREVLQNNTLRLNSQYYICNSICPALNRVFLLLGVNVDNWYSTLPRKTRFMLPQDNRFHVGNNSISRYFLVANCPVCDTESQGGICLNCLTNPQKSAIILMDRIRKWERRYYDIAKVCHGCTNTPEPHLSCISLDCPILFRLAQSTRDLSQAPYLHGVVENFSLTW